jgi:hypothetical protein
MYHHAYCSDLGMRQLFYYNTSRRSIFSNYYYLLLAIEFSLKSPCLRASFHPLSLLWVKSAN